MTITSAVNETGRWLSEKGHTIKGPRAYNQTSSNCATIAAILAENKGFVALTPQEIETQVLEHREARFYGYSMPTIRSPAQLVIRTPDNPVDAHVTFEYRGKEYNYGPSTKDGFPIDVRIPLQRKR